MTILIVSTPYDTHAVAVAWGLRRLGASSVTWCSSDFPGNSTSSIDLSNSRAPSVELVVEDLPHDGSFSAVWWRRLGKVEPMESSHPHDIKIINTESERYLLNAFTLLSASNSRWVNKPDAAHRANNKATQLIAAREVGFEIPKTLFTNDPARLRRFFDENGGKIVYKSFSHGGWLHEDGNLSVLMTSALRAEDLSDDNMLRSCPGIYQQRIDKAFEIRVTVIGTTVIASSIDSQSQGETVDWRYDYMVGHMSTSAFSLSPEIQERCLSLCRNMQLEFACIDLIVTPSGEHVFLELNQAGQFLWQEEADPRLRMLDIFCQHLAGSGGSEYRARADINMAQFRESEDYAQHKEAIDARDREGEAGDSILVDEAKAQP